MSTPPLNHDLRRAFEFAFEADETASALIGPYQLIEKIGEGGFGAVWLAEQQTPVRRQVALKIIKTGMDTRELIARFEAERQALALMDHPNIARVFEAGETEAGRPFFVMELVRGTPITQFCDENRLPVETRLQLFIAVCQAVQHAHQKGIIHRDLKPSNILITLHDRRPVPKVIDFGMAKALGGAPLTDKTLFTRIHTFIGTPAYTSPEQIEMSGLNVDTRSDIYSLGVLLYELLTGRPPFDADTLSSGGLDGARRTLLEIDPPRPSARLRALPEETRVTVARQRGTDLTQLSLALRGDLDWVVMRCLEKDRARRYESASALAREVGHFLANEPISAGPPNAAYRVGKFVRRHRVAVAATAAILGVLIAGVVVSTWQAVRATRAEHQQAELRRAAEISRRDEVRGRSRADLLLADRLLDEGNVRDGLAYLVRAARADQQNPINAIIGQRLMSALVHRDFALPIAPPARMSATTRSASFDAGGDSVWALGDDGVLRGLDFNTGRVAQEIRWTKPIAGFQVAPGILAVNSADGELAVCELAGNPLDGPWAGGSWRTIARGTTRSQGYEYAVHFDNMGRVASRDPAALSTFVLSRDGRGLAACFDSSPRTVCVWNTATGEQVAEVSAGDSPRFFFDHDGARLVTYAAGRTSLWSIPGGARLASGEIGSPLDSGSDDRVLVRAAAGTTDLGGYPLNVRRLETGAISLIAAHFQGLRFARFTPDGGRIVVGAENTTVSVWDLAAGRMAFPPLPQHTAPLSVQFSRDSRTMAVACADGGIKFWDLTTGRPQVEHALRRDRQPEFTSAAMSPDGRRLALFGRAGDFNRLVVTAGAARSLRVSQMGLTRDTKPWAHEPPARLRRITPTRIAYLDPATGREVAGGFDFPEPIAAGGGGFWMMITISNDERKFLVQTTAGGLQAWSKTVAGLRVTALKASKSELPQISPDGEFGIGWGTSMDGGNPGCQIWNLRTGEPVGSRLPFPTGLAVPRMAFSADGTRFAGSGGGTKLWELATGRLIFELPRVTQTSSFVKLSPDGSRIVTGSSTGDVAFWDAQTGELVRSQRLHMLDTWSWDPGAFSPDGRRVITKSSDGTAIVWDTRTGTPLGSPLANRVSALDARLSADGNRVVLPLADQTVRLFDAVTGLPMSDAFPQDRWTGTAIFSPDGRFLESGNILSGVAHIWSIPADGSGAPPPDWLLRLATWLASRRVRDDGVLEDVEIDAMELWKIRDEVNAQPDDAPYASEGKWFLADRSTRPIAPGFKITAAEAAKVAASEAR